MSNILKNIKDKIGAENCRRSCCTRDGCKVDLEGTPSTRVIADADCEFLDAFFPGKRCDFILFFQDSDGTVVIAPLELKHGRAEANSTAEQLQAGACFAERMIQESCGSVCPVCQPILFHGRRLHRVQREELNRAKIRFRGAQLTIQTAKCCQPGNLAKALSDQRGQSQTRRRRKVKSG